MKRLVFLIITVSSFVYKLIASEVMNSDYSNDLSYPILMGSSTNQLLDSLLQYSIKENNNENNYKKALFYLKLGDLSYKQDLYLNSFRCFSSALQIAEEHGFTDLLAQIYNGLGTIYCTWRDYTLGLEYLKKGLDYSDPNNNYPTYRSLLINIQGAYLSLQDIENAKKYFNEMLNLESKEPIIRFFKENNRGLFELEESNMENAFSHFKKAAEIAEENNLGNAILSSVYDYIGDALAPSDMAINYWNKAIELDSIPLYIKLNIIKKLMNIHKERKEREKAIHYGNLYIYMSDSIFKMEEINRTKDIQTTYENDKKLRYIENLEMEKKNQYAKIKDQQTIIIISTTSIFIFVIIITILVIQKKKLNKLYHHLFINNKEINDSQELNKQLKQRLDNNTDYSQEENENEILNINKEFKEHKIQSVDCLTIEKRHEIFLAIERVLLDDSHICNPEFSLNHLAKITGYNSRYVSQVLNDEYGCNFRTKLNECRMKIARERILDIKNYGHLTIQAISESIGYKSQSGFVQIFKKYTGFTPSMFQKMAIKESNKTKDFEFMEDDD